MAWPAGAAEPGPDGPKSADSGRHALLLPRFLVITRFTTTYSSLRQTNHSIEFASLAMIVPREVQTLLEAPAPRSAGKSKIVLYSRL
jgi:hypothetical protein